MNSGDDLLTEEDVEYKALEEGNNVTIEYNGSTLLPGFNSGTEVSLTPSTSMSQSLGP